MDDRSSCQIQVLHAGATYEPGVFEQQISNLGINASVAYHAPDVLQGARPGRSAVSAPCNANPESAPPAVTTTLDRRRPVCAGL